MPRQRNEPDREMHRRAIDRSPEEMRRRIAAGSDPNGQVFRDLPSLITAASLRPEPRGARRLLETGAGPDVRDADGTGPARRHGALRLR